MSFQNYVRTLNNNVDETTACKKYKDFMANLSQSKVGRFFDANKDREWFRLKYHPVEGQKTVQKQNLAFLKRLRIFNELNDRNYFDNLPFSSASSSAVINLMDAIIVQLEDGPQHLVEALLSREDTKIDYSLKEKFVPTRPTSVVIDDISIEATLADLHDVCTKAHSDLIRIAQLEPYYVEGGQLRRKVIAVYQSHVDIRNVCWRLSRMKLNNRSISVRINKCLTKRIHTVPAIANHHLSIVNDIRNAIVLILNFDELKGLHGKRGQCSESGTEELMDSTTTVKREDSFHDKSVDGIDNVAPLSPPGSNKSANEEDEEKPFDISTLDEEKEKEVKKLYEFKFNTNLSLHRQVNELNSSKNPILQGAYTYLVEYVDSSSAKYFLSKVPKDLQDNASCEKLDLNDMDKLTTLQLITQNLPCTLDESRKFLDKMLWYLRIVHSFDYYKKLIYKLEDELTLRLGVVHLRDDACNLPEDVSIASISEYLNQDAQELERFNQSQAQKYVTRDEERFNYKSYGKVITDELASYAQRIQKPKSSETEEVYKCKHCTRIFQRLTDIGRHFVSKHRWAVDAIELETDFFNAYLFDPTKIDPCPPKELIEICPNRFARISNFSQMGEDPDLLQQTIEAYSKMESFVREPAPRSRLESDPRNDLIVDYNDISLDDAI